MITSDRALQRTVPYRRVYTAECSMATLMQDMRQALIDNHVWRLLAVGDIRDRYRRSRLGPIWLAISTLLFVAFVGSMYARIFNAPLSKYIPYIGFGIVLWGVIASSLTNGAQTFTSARGLYTQVPLPLFTQIFRVVARQIFVFAHQAVAIIIVLVVIGFEWHPTALLAIPGLLIYVLNMIWVAGVAGALATRFRDLVPMINAVMPMLFLLTPVLWHVDQVQAESWRVEINPFWHMINLVRAPLLGELPYRQNVIVAVSITVVGWIVFLAIFSKFQNRLRYWM